MISRNLLNRITTSLLLFLVLILIFYSKLLLVYTLIILGVFSILEFIHLIQKILKNRLKIFFISFMFILFVFCFTFLFFFFSNFLQLKIILFIILLSCIASDIGGFIFGKLIGGPKLTKISPNKTISGFVGSIILTILVFTSIFTYLTNDLNYKYFLIAIVISFTCQIGDLFFSFLKRKARIKDTGKILPGHGGVLDRLDGIFLGTTLGFLFFTLIF